MNNAKLSINGSQLQLSNGTDIAITLTANNFLEPDALNSSYTNRFQVPLTSYNLGLLGNVVAQPKIQKAYTLISARLEITGALSQNGSILILEANNNYATCVFISGAASFFEDLGAWPLQGIDMQFSMGARSEANIVANIANDYADDETYCFIDYGLDLDDTDDKIDYYRFYPSPFLPSVMDAIAVTAGWTMKTTGLMADAFFRKCAVAWAGDKHNEENFFYAWSTSFSLTAGAAPGNFVSVNNFELIAGPQSQNFDESLGALVIPSFNGKVYAFIWESTVNIDIATDGGEYDFELRIVLLDEVDVVVTQIDYYDSGLVTGQPANTTIAFPNLIGGYLRSGFVEGNRVQCQIRVNKGLNVVLNDTIFRFDFDIQLNDNGVTDYPPHIVMPEMEAGEFFKQVCFQFGAIPFFDVGRKTIELRMFNDIASDHTGQDWTANFDAAGGIDKQFAYEPYAQSNSLAYDNDSELSESYGSGTISVTSAQLPTTFEMVQLPFSATTDRAFDTSISICKIPVFNDATIPGYSGVLKPRIIYVEEKTGSLYVGTTNVTTFNLSRFGVMTDTQNLMFGGLIGLISNYFTRFTSMLSAMEFVTIYVKLTAMQIATLDLLQPVYLNASLSRSIVAGWYLINEIREMKAGKVAEVDLIKVNL